MNAVLEFGPIEAACDVERMAVILSARARPLDRYDEPLILRRRLVDREE